MMWLYCMMRKTLSPSFEWEKERQKDWKTKKHKGRARGVGVGHHNFWSIVLDDQWSKRICRPKMIVWSLILRWSLLQCVYIGVRFRIFCRQTFYWCKFQNKFKNVQASASLWGAIGHPDIADDCRPFPGKGRREQPAGFWNVNKQYHIFEMLTSKQDQVGLVLLQLRVRPRGLGLSGAERLV